MADVELLAVTSKIAYYAVVTIVVGVGIGYVALHLVADRLRRNGRT